MGLKWSWDFGVKHLVVESDCFELVQQIENSRSDVFQEGPEELKEILLFFVRPWELHIAWCRREMNRVADRLAKHALLVGVGIVDFRQVPIEVADIEEGEMTLDTR